jgi:hypothetical protein
VSKTIVVAVLKEFELEDVEENIIEGGEIPNAHTISCFIEDSWNDGVIYQPPIYFICDPGSIIDTDNYAETSDDAIRQASWTIG